MDRRAAKDHQLDLHRRQYGRSGDRHVASRHTHLKEPWTGRSRSRRVDKAPDSNVIEAARSGNGIVEEWLANVSRRGVVDAGESANRLQSSQDKDSAQTPGWRPHGISFPSTIRGGHKRVGSRDSSIIPEPMTKKARPSTAVISHGPSHRSPVTRITGFPISADSSPPRFEKRTRHKTREDRYDSRKKPKGKRRRATEETVTQSGNAPKKPIALGRDVMSNFQPEAVLNDRLTLQPCLTPGLFQNGRISSPKPVAELAYNSMISVEQPPSRESSWQRQQRLEAKARQRREIELVEASAFLRRKEIPATVHPVIGRERPRDGYEDQKLGYQLPENLPACENRLSTRSITASDSLRDDQRDHTHDKTYVAPARHDRSSSRATTYITWATSGNHQTSLPGNSFDRYRSSTPGPIREALRETGIFDCAGINRNARVSSHDSRRRRQKVHPDGESKNFEPSREQPMIIRYLDKGVMTTDESPPSVLEQSRSLLAARDSFAPKSTADTRAEVLVGATTQEALNEPSCGERHKNSNEGSCRKTATPATRASTAMQAYLVPPTIDLSAKTKATLENNIQEAQTITPTIAIATVSVTEESDVCAKGDAEPEHEAAVDQSDGQVLAPELPAVPPVPCWQHIGAPNAQYPSGGEETNRSAFPEEEALDNSIYDYLSDEIDHREETFWQPRVFSRATSLVSQPRKPHHLSRPQTNGHGSMTRFNPSQFQPSESVIDFITRVEQEVLGPGSLEYVDNPPDEARIWQHDDRLEVPSDTFRGAHSLILQDASINRHLAEPGRRRLEDASDRWEGQPSEIGYYGERPDHGSHHWAHQQVKQPEDEKYDKDEKEEMLAFWRPNYFH